MTQVDDGHRHLKPSAHLPSRRGLLAGLGAFALSGSAARAAWEPSPRVPDPAVKILDNAFRKYYVALATIERLATGMRWSEGPVWMGDARCLLWSDVPSSAIMRWDEITGRVTKYRSPSNFSNGNARDRNGRLITCEHQTRRVTRTELDGTLSVVMDRFDGKQLNSPNDIVSRSDGSVWFTDPAFGPNPSEQMSRPELPHSIYRVDPDGKATLMTTDVAGPNGLAFSPDEKKLYVVEARANPRTIRAFDVSEDGRTLANNRVVIDAGNGTPDGFRVDADGNLWCGWGMGTEELDGVRVFAPDGKPLAHIALPERCANLCFGGEFHNRLFMTATHSVYSLMTNARGATNW
jgi:gluconolactonase